MRGDGPDQGLRKESFPIESVIDPKVEGAFSPGPADVTVREQPADRPAVVVTEPSSRWLGQPQGEHKEGD